MKTAKYPHIMKKHLLLACMACFSLAALADDINLYIVNNASEKTSYAVSDLQKITFSEGNVVLTHTNGQTTAVAISEVSSMYFDTETAEAINLVRDGEVNLDNATIYDLSGRRLNGLQRGVNIIRTAEGKSLKIVKK